MRLAPSNKNHTQFGSAHGTIFAVVSQPVLPFQAVNLRQPCRNVHHTNILAVDLDQFWQWKDQWRLSHQRRRHCLVLGCLC